MTLAGYSSSTDTFLFPFLLFLFWSLFVVRSQKLSPILAFFPNYTTSARPACLPPLPRHSYQEPLSPRKVLDPPLRPSRITPVHFSRETEREETLISSILSILPVPDKSFVVQPLVFGFYSGNGILPSSAVSPRFSALNSTDPQISFSSN
jgi:hypothetical protein